MFEVIISRVKTGQVKRRQFATREEAEQHVAQVEEKLLTPKPSQNRIRMPSLRDYRLEIRYCEPARVEGMPPARAA
jgi:hypothetical protein